MAHKMLISVQQSLLVAVLVLEVMMVLLTQPKVFYKYTNKTADQTVFMRRQSECFRLKNLCLTWEGEESDSLSCREGGGWA